MKYVSLTCVFVQDFFNQPWFKKIPAPALAEFIGVLALFSAVPNEDFPPLPPVIKKREQIQTEKEGGREQEWS